MINLTPAQLAQLRARAPLAPDPLRPPAPASRFGGATFGGGGGGANRYDHTQWGGGLFSIGIDPSQSGFQQQAVDWYGRQPANVRAEVDSFWRNNQRTGNAANDMANAVDWRQRDVARKIKKKHSPLGGLGFAIPLAASFIPGVGAGLSAAIGAGVGGATGGLRGAVLGGLGSAIGPALKVPGIGKAISAPAKAVSGLANQAINPQFIGRQALASSLRQFRRGDG